MKSWIRWDMVFVIMAGACSNGSSNASGSSPASPPDFGGTSGSSSGSGGVGMGVSSPAEDAGLPPEIKEESNFESPVATGNIVWIANPTSGLVAYIDSSSFSVQTVAAGDAPTYLAAIPSTTGDVAIVQNALSHDATLLDNRSGVLASTTFPSTVDANSWAVSTQDPANADEMNARWAIAWTDSTRISNPDPTQGFQEIAIFDLSGGPGARAPQILTVGYRPAQFAFSADESKAYAVTQDGISVIDLVGGSTPTVTANLPLQAVGATGQATMGADTGDADTAPDAAAPDAAEPDAAAADAAAPDASAPDASAPDASAPDASAPDASTSPAPSDASSSVTPTADATVSTSPSGVPDVSFRPDGSMALVRLDGSNVISVIALPSGVTTPVVLPGAPTDLTIAPSGDFAVAVLRDASTVVLLPLPGIASDPGSFSLVPVAGATIGRAIVTKEGNSILLFTTAAPVDAMVVMNAASHAYRSVTLHAPVLAVFPTDDEQNAVVLHNVTPVAGSDVKGAFSLVPVAASLPATIQSLTAAPTAVAIDGASDRALVTLRDDTTGTYGVDLALFPSLQVVPFSLASPPIAAGIVGGEGYVAQDFDEGRITFIDLATQAERTITGFDLGARIVTGGDR
jgi:hypothetical protein